MKLLIQYEDGRNRLLRQMKTGFTAIRVRFVQQISFGEVYDATREDGDPSLISYDDSDWRPVHVVSRTEAALEAQNYPPVRVLKSYPR